MRISSNYYSTNDLYEPLYGMITDLIKDALEEHGVETVKLDPLDKATRSLGNVKDVTFNEGVRGPKDPEVRNIYFKSLKKSFWPYYDQYFSFGFKDEDRKEEFYEENFIEIILRILSVGIKTQNKIMAKQGYHNRDIDNLPRYLLKPYMRLLGEKGLENFLFSEVKSPNDYKVRTIKIYESKKDARDYLISLKCISTKGGYYGDGKPEYTLFIEGQNNHSLEKLFYPLNFEQILNILSFNVKVKKGEPLSISLLKLSLRLKEDKLDKARNNLKDPFESKHRVENGDFSTPREIVFRSYKNAFARLRAILTQKGDNTGKILFFDTATGEFTQDLILYPS